MKKVILVIVITLCFILSGCTNYEEKYEELYDEYSELEMMYDELSSQYNSLDEKYSILEDEYGKLCLEYEEYRNEMSDD